MLSSTNARALSQLHVPKAEAQSDDIPVAADKAVSATDVLNALPKANADVDAVDMNAEKHMPDDEIIAASIKDDDMANGDDALDVSQRESQNQGVANEDGVKHERTAKIVTCPACRLNALPLVKKFVHEHAPHFKPLLQVNFVFGEDPVLHLYEDGKQVAKHNLDVSDHAFLHEFFLFLITKF